MTHIFSCRALVKLQLNYLQKKKIPYLTVAKHYAP
jgi:hypothetical protein